jgi:hypothetical protein
VHQHSSIYSFLVAQNNIEAIIYTHTTENTIKYCISAVSVFKVLYVKIIAWLNAHEISAIHSTVKNTLLYKYAIVEVFPSVLLTSQLIHIKNTYTVQLKRWQNNLLKLFEKAINKKFVHQVYLGRH